MERSVETGQIGSRHAAEKGRGRQVDEGLKVGDEVDDREVEREEWAKEMYLSGTEPDIKGCR